MNFKYVILLILLVGCGVKSTNSDKAGSRKPNIVYILADDLGYGDLGCYGQKIIKTPNLDRLASDGMLFTQHYAGSSVCAPSRASLMTGTHTGHAYIRGNYETGPLGFGACLELRPEDLTVSELVKNAGYSTALIGKWGLGMNGTTGEPKRKGFDYSYGFLNQGHAHNQFPEYIFINSDSLTIEENQNGKMGAFSNDIFTKEALKYIGEQNDDKPFFLYLAYTTPHAEMVMPEGESYNQYIGQVQDTAYNAVPSEKDGPRWNYRSSEHPAVAYAGQITHLDECIGKVLNELEKQGLTENTIVMFSSDNGSHREGGAYPTYFNSSGILKGMKRDLYEGGIRVPFILKWPNIVKSGQISNHISAFWDFLPTVAEITNQMDLVKHTDGISFLPTLKNKEQQEHEYLYWEFHENKTTDQAIRFGNWKAVRHDPNGKIEIYNLKNDPEEMKNLAKEKPELVKKAADYLSNSRTESLIWQLKSKN